MSQLRTRLLMLASMGALAACQEAAPPAAPVAEAVVEAEMPEPPHSALLMMTCGPDATIGRDVTRESLAGTFGAENLADEEVSWVDSMETALVLFPEEPATRAELFWLGKTDGGPRYVRVGGAESQWVGAGGLFIGASLADVEAANGGPFEVMGFQNHNAGEVTDWLGGALAAKPGDTCEFALALELSPDATSEVAAPVSGDPDKVYRSDSPEMKAANPSVGELAVQFFDPS